MALRAVVDQALRSIRILFLRGLRGSPCFSVLKTCLLDCERSEAADVCSDLRRPRAATGRALSHLFVCGHRLRCVQDLIACCLRLDIVRERRPRHHRCLVAADGCAACT